MPDIPCEDLDGCAVAVYLDVPGSKVVLFQAFFEIYEAIGCVRTIDIRQSKVCVVTTRDCLADCERLLNGIKDIVPWRFCERPVESERLFGYSLKNVQTEKSKG